MYSTAAAAWEGAGKPAQALLLRLSPVAVWCSTWTGSPRVMCIDLTQDGGTLLFIGSSNPAASETSSGTTTQEAEVHEWKRVCGSSRQCTRASQRRDVHVVITVVRRDISLAAKPPGREYGSERERLVERWRRPRDVVQPVLHRS